MPITKTLCDHHQKDNVVDRYYLRRTQAAEKNTQTQNMRTLHTRHSIKTSPVCLPGHITIYILQPCAVRSDNIIKNRNKHGFLTFGLGRASVTKPLMCDPGRFCKCIFPCVFGCCSPTFRRRACVVGCCAWLSFGLLFMPFVVVVRHCVCDAIKYMCGRHTAARIQSSAPKPSRSSSWHCEIGHFSSGLCDRRQMVRSEYTRCARVCVNRSH